MEDLTFGEQVKIILGRKGMTIKQLAELIEEKTGKKMSRQNLTQRLGRDNFQEQDMRMIAEILECPFRLSIMSVDVQPQRSTAALERAAAARTEAVAGKAEKISSVAEERVTEENAAETAGYEASAARAEKAESADSAERDVTIGELYDMHRELTELEESVKAGEPVEKIRKELEKPKKEGILRGGLFLRRKQNKNGSGAEAAEEKETAAEAGTEAAFEETAAEQAVNPAEGMEMEPEAASAEAAAAQAEAEAPQAEYAGKGEEDFEPVIPQNDAEENEAAGEINPYTGREYQSNSVRMHPTRIGYVQVYDRTIHKWTDMTEWAFLGLQERKKALLGKAYEPPVYLD